MDIILSCKHSLSLAINFHNQSKQIYFSIPSYQQYDGQYRGYSYIVIFLKYCIDVCNCQYHLALNVEQLKLHYFLVK